MASLACDVGVFFTCEFHQRQLQTIWDFFNFELLVNFFFVFLCPKSNGIYFIYLRYYLSDYVAQEHRLPFDHRSSGQRG